MQITYCKSTPLRVTTGSLYKTFGYLTRKSLVNIFSLGTTTVPSVYLHVHLFCDLKWNNQTVVSWYEKPGKLLPKPRVFFSHRAIDWLISKAFYVQNWLARRNMKAITCSCLILTLFFNPLLWYYFKAGEDPLVSLFLCTSFYYIMYLITHISLK